MTNDLDNLIPLMKKKGVVISKEDFHNTVNKIFHDIESKYYDKIHSGMDTSLQEQFNLIGDDIEKVIPYNTSKKLTLLDIGCGTGMSTDKLLKSSLGKYISQIYLLDTSSGMLQQCILKAKNWNTKYELIEGDIYSLNNDVKYDIILTCSVLHHIPNLSHFINKVIALQEKNGFFIHLQDPNGDYINSKTFLNRKIELRNYLRKYKFKKKLFAIISRKIKNIIYKTINKTEKNYIHDVNEELMKLHIINNPLTDREIWSVTDIHVDNLPNNHGKGISFEFLKNELANYKLIKRRSYGFFGDLKTNLPLSFQEKEESLIHNKELDGRELLGIWQLT